MPLSGRFCITNTSPFLPDDRTSSVQRKHRFVPPLRKSKPAHSSNSAHLCRQSPGPADTSPDDILTRNSIAWVRVKFEIFDFSLSAVSRPNPVPNYSFFSIDSFKIYKSKMYTTLQIQNFSPLFCKKLDIFQLFFFY